jgi:hypothetical protein
VVDREKEGRTVIYRLHPDIFKRSEAAELHLDFGCCRVALAPPPAQA